MSNQPTLTLPNKRLANFCQQSNITFLGLFGSHARGQATSESDIDLLIDFDKSKSLFELSRSRQALQKTLGKQIDLVSRKNLKPALKPYILKDLTTIYQA